MAELLIEHLGAFSAYILRGKARDFMAIITLADGDRGLSVGQVAAKLEKFIDCHTIGESHLQIINAGDDEWLYKYFKAVAIRRKVRI